MQDWQHLLYSLITSKEFWAAIAGALIGGSITGWFTLRAQKQAAKDQRIRDRETEREVIKGTLQAIETEIEVFKTKFLDGFEDVFAEWNPHTPSAQLPKVASLNQSLSSVFDSNTAVLGRIADAALRHKIVATYAKLKVLIDVVNYYAKRREHWENISHQTNQIGLSEVKGEAETWAGNVRRNIPELQSEIAALLADIRKYLDSLKDR